MAEEKRNNERQGLRVFVDEGAAPGSGTLCRAVNVSKTGMYLLRVPSKREQPKFVWLGFKLPDGGEAIRALAEVVHTDKKGALEGSGVRFKYMFPADRKRLMGFLQAARAA